MTRSDNYMGGWIDSSIRNFLYTIESPSASMRYALITCLDSSTDIKHMVKKSTSLKPLENNGKIVGKSLLIETKKLLDAEHRKRIFFGFDEIWFSAAPVLLPKSYDFWLNVPAEFVRQIPDPLIQWMRAGNYSLGLGDGTGLNYVAKVRSVVARSIINAYNETEEKQAA